MQYKKGDIVKIKPLEYFLSLEKNGEIYTPSGLYIPKGILVYCSTKQIIRAKDVNLKLSIPLYLLEDGGGWQWSGDCFVTEKIPLFNFIDFKIKL